MSRAPSIETQLRRAKGEIRALESMNNALRLERDKFRSQAQQAQNELAEWKGRFDKLLDRTPKEPKP